MPQPKISPHLRRLLNDESTRIVSLFHNVHNRYVCCLMAPDTPNHSALGAGVVFAMVDHEDAEAAVLAARAKLWGNL